MLDIYTPVGFEMTETPTFNDFDGEVNAIGNIVYVKFGSLSQSDISTCGQLPLVFLQNDFPVQTCRAQILQCQLAVV